MKDILIQRVIHTATFGLTVFEIFYNKNAIIPNVTELCFPAQGKNIRRQGIIILIHIRIEPWEVDSQKF